MVDVFENDRLSSLISLWYCLRLGGGSGELLKSLGSARKVLILPKVMESSRRPSRCLAYPSTFFVTKIRVYLGSKVWIGSPVRKAS